MGFDIEWRLKYLTFLITFSNWFQLSNIWRIASFSSFTKTDPVRLCPHVELELVSLLNLVLI